MLTLLGLVAVGQLIPLPVGHRDEPPSKVPQLPSLEQRGASWHAPHKMRRPVHLDRQSLATPIDHQVQPVALLQHLLLLHRRPQRRQCLGHVSLQAGRLCPRGSKRGVAARQKCSPGQCAGARPLARVPQAPLVELAQPVNSELVSEGVAMVGEALVEERRLRRQMVQNCKRPRRVGQLLRLKVVRPPCSLPPNRVVRVVSDVNFSSSLLATLIVTATATAPWRWSQRAAAAAALFTSDISHYILLEIGGDILVHFH